MFNSLPIRLIWHSLNWLTRLTIVVSAVMAVLAALTIITLRYVLLPNVEQYHDRITASLTSSIGNPVTIGKIEGNWQGLRPHLSFTDVRIMDGQHQTALVLPRIDGSVSWLSLFAAELRLSGLEIDRPEVLVQRDAQGQIYVGGIALSQQGTNNDLADWLLRQSHTVIRDALIVWVDEQRDAPPLVLQRVNLRIESLFSHHRFALHALPPQGLATPLDIRGDFRGTSFDDLKAWRGQVFTQIDYTDVTAWRPWLDLPDEFSRGRGALRGWLSVGAGRVTELIADLYLRDVVTRLAADVPEMALLNLRGRASWKKLDGGLEISTRGLALQLRNGDELKPTDIFLRTLKAANGQPASGEVRANLLQLESLAGLANYLPLEADLRARLGTYAPRGEVSNLDVQWFGTLENLGHLKIKGQFKNMAMRQVGTLPGFSGLSVDVDGSDTNGRLKIKSHRLMVDASGAMREPLFFDTLTGQASWRHELGEWQVKVEDVAVANDDLAGRLHGSYQTQADTLGLLDLTVNLTRGDLRRAARYIPLVALDREDNDWLNDAMLAGHTDYFQVRVKGNLSDFPLDGTKSAVLEIGGHAQNVAMKFASDWPPIENISGEFWIRGNELKVTSPSAIMLGTQLQNLTVTIADLQSADLPLEIKGSATGASNNFLQFIQQSPVRGYIDGFTDGMRVTGNGHLELFAHIPLQGESVVPAQAVASAASVRQNGPVHQPLKVSGTFSVQGNDINLGEGVPLLRKTRGELVFTESDMHANGVSAEILGGAASINMQTAAGGVVHAAVRGRSNLDTLRKISPHPLLNYLHGSTTWSADIKALKKSVKVDIRSGLQGISADLPQPFIKRAGEPMLLRVEMTPVPVSAEKDIVGGQDVITLQLGRLLRARLVRHDENGAMVVKHGVVHFGGGALGKQPEKNSFSTVLGAGVWLEGSLPELPLQEWSDLLSGPGSMESGLSVAGADIVIGKVSGFGLHIDDLSIKAGRHGDGLLAQLSSSALNGEVEWQPHAEGKLTARLKNLFWSGDDQAVAIPAQDALSVSVAPDNLPAMQIAIENLQMKDKQIGRLEWVGHPDGKDWRLRRLRVTNPDGTLTGDGIWHGGEAYARSDVNLLLEISDAGKILARSGYPKTVKDGSGKLAANLSWIGSPGRFNYATLDGTLKLDTGKGQFLKMDTGAGKLLGILSLQALPKRITLDFADVFSEGFQFDSIKGNAQISNGVLVTQDLRLEGSAAKVTMKGNVDLNSETQNLHVKILPTLGDSVSLLGAFAGGPVVGLGSLLINKVLGNPLDKLASFEYNVSGTWSDPVVVKIGQAPVEQNKTGQ